MSKLKVYIDEGHNCSVCGSNKFPELELSIIDFICADGSQFVGCNQNKFFSLKIKNKEVCIPCFKILLNLESVSGLTWHEMIDDIRFHEIVKRFISKIQSKQILIKKNGDIKKELESIYHKSKNQKEK